MYISALSIRSFLLKNKRFKVVITFTTIRLLGLITTFLNEFLAVVPGSSCVRERKGNLNA